MILLIIVSSPFFISGVAKSTSDLFDNYALTGEWITSCGPPSDGLMTCETDDSRPFVFPTSIAIDSVDNVYITDLWKDKIQKFTGDGRFITEWGSRGEGDGKFLLPTDIAIDSMDNVYVSDIANTNIQKFTSEGEFITKWGSRGDTDGRFNNPIKLAVDSSDNVYVVDQMNRRIQKFTSNGDFIGKWGSIGDKEGQFRIPTGIAVDSDNNIFIVDQTKNQVQKFTSGGTFITKWGTKCNDSESSELIQLYSCKDPTSGEFYYPDGGIAVNSLDTVFVMDQNNNRIQQFNNDGKFMTDWDMPPYSYQNSTMSLLGHSDIATDSNDNIYVIAHNDKVLIFSPLCDNINILPCQ